MKPSFVTELNQTSFLGCEGSGEALFRIDFHMSLSVVLSEEQFKEVVQDTLKSLQDKLPKDWKV